MMAKRASGKRAEAEKTARPRRKVAASTRKPVRRATRPPAAERSEPADVAAPEPAPPSGARVAVDDVLVEAGEPRVERNQLRALLSVRCGDQVVYTEHVNLDWPGGREKFLRKATRALGAAGIATRISEALLDELRALARARAAATPRV